MTPLQGFGLGQLGMVLAIFFLSFEFSAEWKRRRRIEAQLRKDLNQVRNELRAL